MNKTIEQCKPYNHTTKTDTIYRKQKPNKNNIQAIYKINTKQ